MPVPRAPTERFGDRVGDYLRYRPGYPGALPGWLHAQGAAADALVADIGAGTGQSARMWLDAGHDVVAVEPNDAMREAGAAAAARRAGRRWV